MTLVLIEDIADHIVTTPAHDVVVLAALTQMHLGRKYLRPSVPSSVSRITKLGVLKARGRTS